MYRRLDGPSKHGSLTVTNAAVQELKVEAQAFSGRSVITLISDKRVLIYFGDDTATAPSVATVAADGFLILKNQLTTLEAGKDQPVYILAVSDTANVSVAERG